MTTLFMQTTNIPATQTVAEIQKILGRYGASAIRTDYENGEVVSVTFSFKIDEGDPLFFRLPCRWQEIKSLLESRRKRKSNRGRPSGDLTDQSKRIAWRQILRWVEAQMAMTETNMVKVHEVFLHCLLINKNQTLFEKMESVGWQFQLEHKK